MSDSNGNGIAKRMIMEQAVRAEKAVFEADYSKCPVKGEKEVQSFLVSGMKFLLEADCAKKSAQVIAEDSPRYKRILQHPNSKMAYAASIVVAIYETAKLIITSKGHP